MIVPAILLLASAALGLLALRLGFADLALLSVPAGVAALWLALRRARPPRYIVVDGSNVIHWQDNRPALAPLQAVIARLQDLGYVPGVVFDANAGHKLGQGFQDDRALARLLGLPPDRVLLAPRGTPADPLILSTARAHGARIVSNDRFRQWEKDHPEIRLRGHLVTGHFRDGELRLDLR